MTIYRVYVTLYRGGKVPPFYIGSTSEVRLKSGYSGSIKSKRWRAIWKLEREQHAELFCTKMLSAQYHTRKDALAAERRLQVALGVVRNPMYVNQSIAAKNGCFGRDVSGDRGHTDAAKQKISLNHADFSGSRNGRAETFEFISPLGQKTLVYGEFKKFCAEQKLPLGSALFLPTGRIFTRGRCAGWQCRKL